MIPIYEYRTPHISAWHDTKSFSAQIHQHEHIEFVYLNHGKIILDTVSNKFEMKDGDFAVIFPYSLHGYKTDSKLDYFICICPIDGIGGFRDTLMQKHVSNPIISASELHPDVKNIVYELSEISMNSNQNLSDEDDLLVDALCHLLIARTIPKLNLTTNTPGFESSFLVRVVKYMSENYMHPITIEKMATELRTNRFTLSRIFNEQLHISFPQYINSLRVENAKKLLSLTNERIIDISMECGYDNLRTFNRVFHQSTGLSPRQYRFDHREINSSVFFEKT